MPHPTPKPTPTDQMLAIAGLPPLTRPAVDTAVRLAILLHFGIDWDNSWVRRRLNTYWGKGLPERLVLGTATARDLGDWWQVVSDDLDSAPRNTDERRELAALLNYEPAQDVLNVFREQPAKVALYVQIVAEERRRDRAAAKKKTAKISTEGFDK